MNKFYNSIKFKLSLILFIFTIFILFSLTLANMFIFEKYYTGKKIAEIKQAFNIIDDIGVRNKKYSPYNKDMGIDYDKAKKEYKNILQVYSSKYNISIVIVDTTNNTTLMSNERSGEELLNRIYEYMFKCDDKNVECIYSDNFKILKHKYSNDNINIELVGYCNDNRTMVLMSTPLAGIKENVLVVNRFLGFIGFIALFISLILMFFMSNMMTKRIIRIANISKKVSKFDFCEKYQVTNNDEIDILGYNMNIMSDNLKKLIEELKQANSKLKDDIEKKNLLEKQRKEFIANISHELKTPIALISGYAEGLREGLCEDTESRKFYTDVIIDETIKMNNLVKQLLQLSEIESGYHVIDKLKFNSYDFLKNIYDKYNFIYNDKAYNFVCNIKASKEILADEFKLEEIINNYLNNAINHVDDNKYIELSSYIDNDGKVVMSVFNSGSYIKDEDIEYIWDKFYKADKSHSRQYGGSGIGLSIVKAIAMAHNFDYGVKNTYKTINDNKIKGVLFYIRI